MRLVAIYCFFFLAAFLTTLAAVFGAHDSPQHLHENFPAKLKIALNRKKIASTISIIRQSPTV